MTVPGVLNAWIRSIAELDSPVFRTIARLTISPGAVCRAYIEGDRASYTNPAKYCFLAGAFAVLSVALFGRSEVTGAVVALPPWIGPDHPLGKASETMTTLIRDYAHIFTLATIPVFSAVLWAIHRRARLTLAEHIVFALYIHGQIFIAQGVLAMLGGYTTVTLIIAQYALIFAYVAWSITRFYRVSIPIGVLLTLPAIIAAFATGFVLTRLALVALILWYHFT